MTNEELQAYLYAHIPLSAAMAVEPIAVTAGEVRLRAPLAPNLNHRGTGFGGSVATLAILAGWSLVHVRTRAFAPEVHVVIQHQEVHFGRPITDAFEAHATAGAEAAWGRLERAVRRFGRGRIWVDATVRQGATAAGRFRGAYVVLAAAPLDEAAAV